MRFILWLAACAAGLSGTQTAAQNTEERFFYLRKADFQCLVAKAAQYRRTEKSDPVVIVLEDCPKYPEQSTSHGQYAPPIAKGRPQAPVTYPDEVIPLTKQQLECLSRRARVAEIGRTDPKTGLIKLPTAYSCRK